MAKALQKAAKAKNDEFYTQLSTIENELQHYQCHFEGKVVLCNCDDPRESKFFEYFYENFKFLGLKRLITTCYRSKNINSFSKNDSDEAVYLIHDEDGKKENLKLDPEKLDVQYFEGNGDFRSAECVKLLEQADIVCTNPPFSLFREYIAQLMELNKQFLIIGSPSAISYKEVFKYIKANQLWIGFKPMGADMLFDVSESFAEWLVENKKEGSGYKIVDDVIKARSPAIWFTNLEHSKRNEDIFLCEEYNPKDYPTYDNYDAIEVGKVADIPDGYKGEMGVPITFLGKYNPKQFKIVGNEYDLNIDKGRVYVKGKRMFSRIIIKTA